MSGYVPRDGSVAQRVIWHLEQHGRSSTTTIVENVDDVTRSGLPGCMATAVSHGAVFVGKVEGETWYDLKPFENSTQEAGAALVAAMGIGVTPAPGTREAPPDTPQGDTKAKSSERQAVQGPAAKALNGARPAPPSPAMSPGVGPTGAGQAADAAPAGEHRPFRCALWSDGRLVLEVPAERLIQNLSAETLTLTPAETQALVHYLERMAEVAS